ncbi:MAG: tRNA (adenosine(37)-N6)-dimethylallyltransferase MiaA [Gemmatimonadaceae bacterium]|nr:tRNA (adenosine(37)-N6)-dimethylallyltransferase MiaA [Gemmatimonadaceae bacterium]NUQ92870.1 tRNA (adenosine(37)-N6)-dimethylallyltransferase MiaA [Gemmatimonadaceae bacterium]NUR20614.1 tRNA (adenosine(37)-N6)-dimethylallyltransferase MiaA [Gemmatimonadaceae bacterium]NUS96364.1 tRNA (adenosine(37)-N6)-dimethylallyltransferase MiaA [Gemmatimonadaceae bacterium]
MADAELRVITGPTAAGKSGLALELARRHGAVIVSADSRQIYRRFDIGTAKPTPAERDAVPHFGIDVVDPGERWSAAHWAEDAERWVDEARATGREVVIVGGTGFYLRALFSPLFDEPALDPVRRLELQRELAARSTTDLRRWCETLDPARAHLGRARLLRAIEVALLTGARLSELHARPTRAPRFHARYLVVDPGPTLGERIARRVDGMFAAGWADEVRDLMLTIPDDAPAWNAAGYEAVRDEVRGVVTHAAARERVIIETRQYAKRQRTWLRHQLDAARVTRLDPAAAGAIDEAERWWNGATG